VEDFKRIVENALGGDDNAIHRGMDIKLTFPEHVFRNGHDNEV